MLSLNEVSTIVKEQIVVILFYFELFFSVNIITFISLTCFFVILNFVWQYDYVIELSIKNQIIKNFEQIISRQIIEIAEQNEVINKKNEEIDKQKKEINKKNDEIQQLIKDCDGVQNLVSRMCLETSQIVDDDLSYIQKKKYDEINARKIPSIIYGKESVGLPEYVKNIKCSLIISNSGKTGPISYDLNNNYILKSVFNDDVFMYMFNRGITDFSVVYDNTNKDFNIDFSYFSSYFTNIDVLVLKNHDNILIRLPTSAFSKIKQILIPIHIYEANWRGYSTYTEVIHSKYDRYINNSTGMVSFLLKK